MTRLENELLNYKSKYTDTSGTLKNEIGINDRNKLERVERTITNYKLANLYLHPELSLENGVKKYSVNHYLCIHKYLFEDIYSFAGKIRDESINKTIPFCLPQFIYNSLESTLSRMYKESKKISNREELLNFIVRYYPELDVIHPFREGNGRCEREFFRQYIKDICVNNELDNYYLDFSLITDKKDFIKAVIDADICVDDNHLREIFSDILVCYDKGLKK